MQNRKIDKAIQCGHDAWRNGGLLGTRILGKSIRIALTRAGYAVVPVEPIHQRLRWIVARRRQFPRSTKLVARQEEIERVLALLRAATTTKEPASPPFEPVGPADRKQTL